MKKAFSLHISRVHHHKLVFCELCWAARKNTLEVTHRADTESERILETRSSHSLEELVDVDTIKMNNL
jgi:hypothetical protein